VELILGERPGVGERRHSGCADLIQRVGRSDAQRVELARDRSAELLEELGLVIGDQRAAVEGVIVRCEGVDGGPEARRDDELI
jgi:hypothetical protein